MNINTTKRTCNGCAASKHNRCDLGYSATFASDEPTFIRATGTPHEKCPKPLNNNEYCEASRLYRKRYTLTP